MAEENTPPKKRRRSKFDKPLTYQGLGRAFDSHPAMQPDRTKGIVKRADEIKNGDLIIGQFLESYDAEHPGAVSELPPQLVVAAGIDGGMVVLVPEGSPVVWRAAAFRLYLVISQ